MEVVSLLYSKSKPPWYLTNTLWIPGLTMLVHFAGMWLFF